MFGPCRRMSVCLCVHIFVCLHSPSKSIWKKAFPESHLGKLVGQFFIYTGQPHPPHSGQRDLPSAPPAGKSSFSDPNGPDPFLSPWPSSTSRSLVDGSLLMPANPAGQLMCRVTMDTVIKVSESYFQGLQNERKWFLPCRTVKLREAVCVLFNAVGVWSPYLLLGETVSEVLT